MLKYKRFNARCTGQSYHHKLFYLEHAEAQQEPIPYVHRQRCQSHERQPSTASILHPSSAAQRGLWPLTTHAHEWWIVSRQLCNVPRSQGKLHSLIGSPSVLPFLCPARSTSSAVTPSCLPCQVISWPQITKSEQLQFDFPPHTSVYTHRPLNWPLLPDFQRISKMATLWQKAAFSPVNESFFEAEGH